MVKIVEELKDPNTYRVKCQGSRCGRILEYQSDDLKPIDTNSGGTLFGISCPTCRVCITAKRLKNIRKDINHVSIWDKMLNLLRD